MPPAESYLQTQVMTASPYELHLMVVDGAVRYAKFARQALEQHDYEMAHLSLGKSRDFVAELISGLNPEHKPDLIDRLKALFQFAWKNLAEADLEHNPKKITNALRVLETHRETWKELGQKLKSPDATSMDAPAAPSGSAAAPRPHFLAAEASPSRLSRTV